MLTPQAPVTLIQVFFERNCEASLIPLHAQSLDEVGLVSSSPIGIGEQFPLLGAELDDRGRNALPCAIDVLKL
jgi:hypothetical protein